MALVIFQCDGACVEAASGCRVAPRTGHLISISPESSSIPQRISRQACLLCLHTPQTNGKLVSWSPWSSLTAEDSSCCWSLSNPCGGQVLTQSLLELRTNPGWYCSLSLVVLSQLEKKNLRSLDAKFSSLEFLPHVENKTQGNNTTVFVTHILRDLTAENNLHFIQALFTWD